MPPLAKAKTKNKKPSGKKPRKGSKENPVDAKDILKALADDDGTDPFIIMDARIKDGFCIYSMKVTRGIGTGDIHPGIKGAGIVFDSMYDAAAKLRKHLAYMAGAFRLAGITREKIEAFELTEQDHANDVDVFDKLEGHEITQLFHVDSFTITGDEGDEGVILTGNMFSQQAAGRLSVKTGKIMMDKVSSYDFADNLRACVDAWRDEVAEYKKGRYTAVTTQEEKEKGKNKKLSIFDAIATAAPESKSYSVKIVPSETPGETTNFEDVPINQVETDLNGHQNGFDDLANAATKHFPDDLDDDFSEAAL